MAVHIRALCAEGRVQRGDDQSVSFLLVFFFCFYGISGNGNLSGNVYNPPVW